MYRILSEKAFTPPVMSALNLVARLSSQLLVLAVALFVLPVEDFIILQLLLTTVGISMAFDFGLTPTISRLIAYKVDVKAGSGASIKKINAEYIQQLLYCSKKIFTLFALILGLSLFLLNFYLDNTFQSASDPLGAVLSWNILAAGCVIQIYNMFFVSFFTGTQNIQLQQFVQACTVVITTIISSVLLLIFENIIFYSIVFFFGAIFNNYIFRKYHRKSQIVEQASNSFYSFQSVSVKIFAEIWESAWRSGMGIASMLIYFFGLNLYVIKSFSESEAAAYLFLYQIFRAISQFSGIPMYSKVPRLAQIYTSGDLQKLDSMGCNIILKSNGIYLAFGLLLLVFYLPAIEFFRAEINVLPLTYIYLMFAALFFERIAASHANLLAIKNILIWHKYNISIIVIAIFVIYISESQIGIFAIPSGYLAGGSIVSLLYIIPRAHEKMQFGFWNFEKKSGSIATLLVLLITGAYVFRQQI